MVLEIPGKGAGMIRVALQLDHPGVAQINLAVCVRSKAGKNRRMQRGLRIKKHLEGKMGRIW